jgi:hypothetical protein
MSPAMQKLRKSLDQAKARHPAHPSAAAATQPVVGFDVIEMLFAAMVGQDAEIRRLKGEKVISDEKAASAPGSDSPVEHAAPDSDAYVGRIESPASPPVYTLKQALSPHPQKPALDETV